VDEILKVKTSVEKSISYYIVQSDASQTVNEISKVKTIEKKPMYYYIESPAPSYVSNGRYSKEYMPIRENNADRLKEDVDQFWKNQDIQQQEQQMLRQKKTQEYYDEKVAENERNKECLRNTGMLCKT